MYIENIDILDFKLIEKSFDIIKSEFFANIAKFKVGNVSTNDLEDVFVSVYDRKMNVFELATISVLSSSALNIVPWDKSTTKLISKAIFNMNMDVNIVDKGANIEIHFPPTTMEKRERMVKSLSVLVEKFKVRARNIRQKLNSELREFNKKSEISDDQLSIFEKHVQKTLDMVIVEIDKLFSNKKRELLRV